MPDASSRRPCCCRTCGTTASIRKPTSWMCSSAVYGKRSTARSPRNCCRRSEALAMSSGRNPPFFTRTFGLRIALWYATLFIIGSMVIVFLTYALTASSLAQRDRQLINAKLGEYAAVYSRGGLGELTQTVRDEQRTAPENLFVAVMAR